MDNPPDIPARFVLLFAGLRAVIGAHLARDRTAGPWIVAAWTHLRRVAANVERIFAHIRAGTVPPLRAGFKLTKPRRPPTRPAFVLATHSFWLGQVIQQSAVYGAWLRQILDDPDMPALLAAAPQLARILRPLCRALGVEPPPLPPRPGSSPAPRAGVACTAAHGRGDGGSAATQSGTPAAPDPLPQRASARRQRARPKFVWPAPIRPAPREKPA